jgi:hypothetical protein
MRQAETQGWLHRVGPAQPDHSFFGVVSIGEKELVESSARMIQNDYFVRCEDSGAGTRRLILKSGKMIETKKDVVLVNCRTSGLNRNAHNAHNALTLDAHPLRPDGSLRPGSLLGFTGPSAYGITLLHVNGKSEISFYGAKHMLGEKSSAAQAGIEFFGKVIGNTMFKLGKELDRSEMAQMSLNGDFWQPTLRKYYAMSKMVLNAKAMEDSCNNNLNLLLPHDQVQQTCPVRPSDETRELVEKISYAL